jgi:hypothetical protein
MFRRKFLLLSPGFKRKSSKKPAEVCGMPLSNPHGVTTQKNSLSLSRTERAWDPTMIMVLCYIVHSASFLVNQNSSLEDFKYYVCRLSVCWLECWYWSNSLRMASVHWVRTETVGIMTTSPMKIRAQSAIVTQWISNLLQTTDHIEHNR